MKNLIVIFWLVFSFNLTAQKLDTIQVYLGIYTSDKEGQFLNLQWENDLEIAFLRAEFLTNSDDHRIFLKMAGRIFKYKNIRVYLALPPFQYSFNGHGYSTPLNLEVQIKKRWLFNIDVYKDGYNLSLQLRKAF